MSEKTLVIIKPDGIRHMPEILKQLKSTSVKILSLRMEMLSSDQIKSFSREHEGRYYYDRLTTYLATGPVMLLAVSGENAIDAMLSFKKSIREQFAINQTIDVLHSSDHESAERELNLFFDANDYLDYEPWSEKHVDIINQTAYVEPKSELNGSSKLSTADQNGHCQTEVSDVDGKSIADNEQNSSTSRVGLFRKQSLSHTFKKIAAPAVLTEKSNQPLSNSYDGGILKMPSMAGCNLQGFKY